MGLNKHQEHGTPKLMAIFHRKDSQDAFMNMHYMWRKVYKAE